MSENSPVRQVQRWRFPLYAQVLLWLLINIALVFLVLWFVLRIQLGVSVEDVFADQLRGRVEPRAEVLASQLRDRPQSEWEEFLAAQGEELEVHLGLLSITGQWFGKKGLPQKAVAQAEKDFEAEMSAGESFPPPRERRPPREGGPDSGEGPQGGRGGSSRPPPTLLTTIPPARMIFSERTQKEGRWAGVEVDLAGEQYRHPPQALLLLFSGKGQKNEIFLDWGSFVVLGVVLLLLSGLVWLPFVHRVTKRLRLMAEGAERISEGDFQVNVASSSGDEIGRLSRVIQRMSSRLSLLVEGQKRFLGDTAHELCSPLVRIRMGLGVLEQSLEGADRKRLEAVEEEVTELARLVDELLEFSKASLASGDLSLHTVDVRALCEEVSAREAMGNPYQVEGGSGLQIETNPDVLKRALGNLVRNSVRYGEGKPLKVKIEKHADEVWIGVLDRGPGLPEGWTERVFEPFARPDEARTRQGGGAGLGLAIVKTCAESLGGRVFCRNRETGGLEVVLVISLLKD